MLEYIYLSLNNAAPLRYLLEIVKSSILAAFDDFIDDCCPSCAEAVGAYKATKQSKIQELSFVRFQLSLNSFPTNRYHSNIHIKRSFSLPFICQAILSAEFPFLEFQKMVSSNYFA